MRTGCNSHIKKPVRQISSRARGKALDEDLGGFDSSARLVEEQLEEPAREPKQVIREVEAVKGALDAARTLEVKRIDFGRSPP